MAARRRLRERPIGVTLFLTVVGYGLVIGTFLLDLPIYPDLTNAQVNVLTHAIAVINLATTVLIVLGWYWIRTEQIEKHRAAMIGAFATILLFLVVYLVRVGGGGDKLFVGPDTVYYAYLIMLAIHIILSIVAVPVVLYALILGLTHTPAELRRTAHARVGQIAAASWLLSLVLGIVTYLMLNHIYSYEFGMLVPMF
ncbi:hypothetical protein AArcMg_1049 [Natrarchaeobaculum sulfurireducens]|uniref:DUF420 domain-containing protein n=1 Tax=Natrarchaeobaculum sulfurireducens TaxID=2044521 RepID=A0A346PNH0_9EURY|nr:hypothetical protein AArc1_2574 [Natrarchaeobaculum sulfurireducens]AXR81065.1 hypothetical protein AArcMg_1049 [Natrarchaeobaculum sulfurireducens]